MFSEFTKGALNEKLNLSAVKKPSGKFGPKGDYIEGWHAIAEANRIFGFDGWSYRIVEMTECHTPTKNEKGNHGVSFIARVEVTAGGVTREDVGYGSGFASQIGDAYESAVKESVTDALKRSLRTFGNPFGLALYDKTQANVEDDVTKKPAPRQQQVTPKVEQTPLDTPSLADQLAEIHNELLDCHSAADLKKCADIWQSIATRDGWSRDAKLKVKEKFDARRAMLASDTISDIQDAFPGSKIVNEHNRELHNIEAGE